MGFVPGTHVIAECEDRTVGGYLLAETDTGVLVQITHTLRRQKMEDEGVAMVRDRIIGLPMWRLRLTAVAERVPDAMTLEREKLVEVLVAMMIQRIEEKVGVATLQPLLSSVKTHLSFDIIRQVEDTEDRNSNTMLVVGLDNLMDEVEKITREGD